MSARKASGKLKQHVNPSGKRLGLKVSNGQKVTSGNTLIRQRGTQFSAGDGVKTGRDHTLYSTVDGVVRFSQKLGKRVVSIIK